MKKYTFASGFPDKGEKNTLNNKQNSSQNKASKVYGEKIPLNNKEVTLIRNGFNLGYEGINKKNHGIIGFNYNGFVISKEVGKFYITGVNLDREYKNLKSLIKDEENKKLFK